MRILLATERLFTSLDSSGILSGGISNHERLLPSLPTKYRSELLIFRLYTVPVRGAGLLITAVTRTGPLSDFKIEPGLKSWTETHCSKAGVDQEIVFIRDGDNLTACQH